MFNAMLTCYLFLGGIGAGALVFLSTFEVIKGVRALCYSKARDMDYGKDLLIDYFPLSFYRYSWPMCLTVLVFAILCLSFDLGRFDRIFFLFTSPSPTPITIGAYSLVVAVLCTLCFTVFRLLDSFSTPMMLLVCVGILGMVSGIIAAVYTGVLLANFSSILFWQSPWLPAVFFLSSLSGGIAVLLLSLSFVEGRKTIFGSAKLLVRIDTILIVFDAVCLATYLTVSYFSPSVSFSVMQLIWGDIAWMFWGGVVVCGIAAPFVLEVNLSRRSYRMQVLWIVLLILVGSLALRFCIVETAVFDITQATNMMYQL